MAKWIPGVAVALVAAVLGSGVAPVPAAAAPGPGAYWPKEPHVAIRQQYQAVVGDFNADGYDDIYWYGYATDPDYMWVGDPGGSLAGTFSQVESAPQVNGVYTPLAGDFVGDRADDIFWYGQFGKQDRIWVMSKGHVRPASQRLVTVNGIYSPFVVDDVGRDSIVWPYAGGGVQIWSYTAHSMYDVHADIPTTQLAGMHAGDFDGDGLQDLFLPARGPAPERVIWRNGRSGAQLQQVAEDLPPNTQRGYAIGQFDGAAGDDILIQDEGSDTTQARVWFGREDRGFDGATATTSAGEPIVIHAAPGTGDEDHVLLVKGPASDHVWQAPGRVVAISETGNSKYTGSVDPLNLTGFFSGGIRQDLLNNDYGYLDDQMYLAPPTT